MHRERHKTITFTNVLSVAKEYSPKPAIHFIPEWYKKMESSFPKKQTPDTTPTIKKCIPVLDAMTAGYIIVSSCDIYVSIVDGEPSYNSAIPNMIHFHSRKQAYLHPSSNDYQFPKFINPWAIKTPKGYSTLFIPPMHQPNDKFVILEGIVDTDTYNQTVHFPFVLKNPNEEFMIPAGTPIAQVIPFKRDTWKSEFSTDTTSATETNTYLISQFFNRYKKMFWSRKSYQ